MATDPRGILRGKCTVCACVQYIRPQDPNVKCSQCKHPPGKHVNMATSLSAQPAAPQPRSYARAVNPQVAHTTYLQSTHSSTGSATTAFSSQYGSGYSGSSYVSSHYDPVPPSVRLSQCPAKDCLNKVHYDSVLGSFDYCSPECRDRDLLPKERQKLEEDIRNFSKNIADLPPLDPVRVTNHGGKETFKKIVVEKRPKEDLGIVIRKDRLEDGLLVVGVKVRSPAFESVKKGEVEFLDVITEVNGEPCMMESEYQESVRSKTRPELTLKRCGAMPSIKKLLSEVQGKHSSATHILVLQNPQKIGGGLDFGLEPVFIKDQGVMLGVKDIPESSAYQSRVTKEDIVMTYAILENTKIGTFKPPSKKSPGEEMKDFESDIKRAARDGNSMILVLKRL